jgi:hypothetical protein
MTIFKPRGLLLLSLTISLIVHAAVLTHFYFHPWILQNPLQSLFGLSAAEPVLLEKEEESSLLNNHLIQEAFQKIVVLSPHFQEPYDLAELPQGIALAPSQERAELPSLEKKTHLLFSKPQIEYASIPKELAIEKEEWDIPALFTPSEIGAPIASQLQVDGQSTLPHIPVSDLPTFGEGVYEDFMLFNQVVLEESEPSEHAINLSAQKIAKSSEAITLKVDPKMATALVGSQKDKREETLAPLSLPNPLVIYPDKKEVRLASSTLQLEDYDFSDITMPGEWNDDFDVDITFLPHPEGKGYIFSLALSSHFDLSSHSLKQHFYFLIDRSTSVQKHRFNVFKRATLKALSNMQQGDTFNILVLDKKITRFSPQNLPVSLKNIQAAEGFLDKQEAGGFFGSSDIYTAIDKLLPFIPEDEEQHTAILLTDGKTSMNPERKQSTFKTWVAQNKKRVSLYACAIGADNDLVSLDMLCSVTGGKLLYSDTHASFPRKLSKLVLDLKDPVAKELTISAIPENPKSRVTFYPAGSHLSTLFGHQPYVIVGHIDEPCAFDLILQGRHRGEWIAIKKNISFIDGHKGDAAFEKRWRSERANLCYAKFLKEGNLSHLKEAQEILEKSRCEVVFK